jgi:predicted DNA-binding protein (MmcQ/YjbR family)
LPQTYEDAPWGFPVFKVADNKLFAWMIADENALHVTMKLTPDERELARMLPYVRKASHLGRYGWITAAVTDDESLESALEWIRESYWLRAPVELRKAVETVENVDDEPR